MHIIFCHTISTAIKYMELTFSTIYCYFFQSITCLHLYLYFCEIPLLSLETIPFPVCLTINSVHTRGGVHSIHSRKFFLYPKEAITNHQLLRKQHCLCPLLSLWSRKTLKVSAERFALSVVAQSLSHA